MVPPSDRTIRNRRKRSGAGRQTIGFASHLDVFLFLIFGRGRRRFPDPAPHQKTKLSLVKHSVVKERALVPQSHPRMSPLALSLTSCQGIGSFLFKNGRERASQYLFVSIASLPGGRPFQSQGDREELTWAYLPYLRGRRLFESRMGSQTFCGEPSLPVT